MRQPDVEKHQFRIVINKCLICGLFRDKESPRRRLGRPGPAERVYALTGARFPKSGVQIAVTNLKQQNGSCLRTWYPSVSNVIAQQRETVRGLCGSITGASSVGPAGGINLSNSV